MRRRDFLKAAGASVVTPVLVQGDPEGKVWCRAMADAPIRVHDWLWIPNTDSRLQTLDKLGDMYCRSVGHNANLILGVVPNRDGLIPETDFQRCAELGREIRRRFGTPMAETSGTGSTVELEIARPTRVNGLIVQEDIRQDERARRYTVEALLPGNGWRPLCDGLAMGPKRIQRFEAVEAKKLRLRIHESTAAPGIRHFAAYRFARD